MDTFHFRYDPQALYALSPHAVKTYLVLLSLRTKDSNLVTISNATLAKFMGRSPNIVRSYVAELALHDIVEVIRQQDEDGRQASNTYVVGGLF